MTALHTKVERDAGKLRVVLPHHLCNAFGVTVTRQVAESLKVKVLASASNKCDVWVYLPWAYWNGTYTIGGAYSSWTHSGTHQTGEPTGGTVQQVAYMMNAENAAKTATNYLKFDSSGLCVGNHTTALTYNTLIKSSGMDIRNGSTVLASYTASAIELGRNSQGSLIKLAGNKVVLAADQSEGWSLKWADTSKKYDFTTGTGGVSFHGGQSSLYECGSGGLKIGWVNGHSITGNADGRIFLDGQEIYTMRKFKISYGVVNITFPANGAGAATKVAHNAGFGAWNTYHVFLQLENNQGNQVPNFNSVQVIPSDFTQSTFTIRSWNSSGSQVSYRVAWLAIGT